MASTFYTWMKQFRDEDTARGDLARDMKWDGAKNLYNLKRKGMRERLQNKAAFDTFEECYQQYLDYFGLFVEGSKKQKLMELAKRFGEPIGHLRGILILRAIRRLDWPEGWRVFCSYCLRWHLHGITPGQNLGHRVAHCSSANSYDDYREESGYWRIGYFLYSDPVCVTKKSDKIISKTKERTRKFFEDDET